MSIALAINGFGRIGKTFLRLILEDPTVATQFNVVGINVGPCDPDNIATLFKYDSLNGIFGGTVTYQDSTLTINGKPIPVFREKDPTLLPWKTLNVEWVVEASGHFTTREKAALHLAAGAKKVLITAPALDADVTIIPGVNDTSYNDQKHAVVSLGSCTTNCFAPIVKVLNEKFGIQWGLMSTVHAYTNDQMLLDGEHSDARRARAAGINIVPTKTGADRVITHIFPELEGKLRGIALRVPVPKVSILDLTFVAAKDISAETINQAFTEYAAGPLKNILACATTPLVSSDFCGNQASAIIDTLLTQTVGNLGKVFGWYDNEVGYCARLRDFLLHK